MLARFSYLHKCSLLCAGGVEVCIYRLDETEAGSSLEDQSSKISTWIQHGRTAVLQPLAHQEVLDGGLRRATKVVCTWAEGDVLKLGSVYVVKAFRPEVVRIWQKVFPISTSLHLCLRVKILHLMNKLYISTVDACNFHCCILNTKGRCFNYVCMYCMMCVCVCVYIYIYIYIHTHIHN